MATLIKEIASELADLYPGAKPADILGVIIEAIESEQGLGDIVAAIRLPTPEENLLRELIKSRQLNRRQAVQNEQKKELIAVLTTVQAQSVSLGGQSYSRSLVSRDGAKVTLAAGFQLSNSSCIKLRTTPTKMDEPLFVDDTFLKPAMEIAVQNVGDLVISSTAILQYIGEKIDTKQRLSFDDIAKLNWVLQSVDEEVILHRLLACLERDVKLRNDIFHINCISDLYKGEDLLPIELRAEHPSSDDLTALIYERIAAITVHEYRLIHRLLGDSLIKGEITYTEYIKQTDEYANNASKLCPRQYR